ncbi:hypothetical protein AB1E18_013426 [Capra hircus]
MRSPRTAAKSGPRAPRLEKACAAAETQHHQKTLQAPLSIGFPRPEYWSGLPFPSPEDLPNPGISCIAGGFFTTEPPGKSGYYFLQFLRIILGRKSLHRTGVCPEIILSSLTRD